MYWSAALSLKTSRDKQYRPNYGSFGTGIRIPESIPEHKCLSHFASPRLQYHEELKLAEYHDRMPHEEDNDRLQLQAALPASTIATTFEMLLASTHHDKLSETTSLIPARAASSDEDDRQGNYWMQERERLRAARARKTGRPQTCRPMASISSWKTAAIMFSVPLLLVVAFVLVVLLSGNGDAVSEVFQAAVSHLQSNVESRRLRGA